ncbi:MAG: cobalamin-binding protein [Bacteroidota bacterium]
MDYSPQRIICLTEEVTEAIYCLGASDRIVGISGFVMHPPKARKEKPKVSTFIKADIEKIIGLKPDLVIGFSDLQADIAQKLIKNGITVWINNYRSVQGIFKMMMQLGGLLNKTKEAKAWIQTCRDEIDAIKKEVAQWPSQPSVYFEEWNDPIITGIQWVGEIIELAGGIDVFPELSSESLAKNRILSDPNEVVKRNPDIIMASWCGKKFKKEKLINRPNWSNIKAVREDHIYEIPSNNILQAGPAALKEGLTHIHEICKKWVLQKR